MEKVDQAVAQVDAFMAKYPTITQYDQLKQIESKTGYSKVYFFVAGVVILSSFIMLVGGVKLVTDLLGFLYPAYMSFKSMESADGGIPEDATQWLTYWVVFSFLTVFEQVAGFLTSWIPLYFYLKTAVIVFLWHPKTKGAEVVYQQVIKVYIVPHLEKVQATKKVE